MTAIIISQLILICTFKFWPETKVSETKIYTFDDSAIIVEEMIITKQSNAPASPPKPQVPIPVPSDIIIEDIVEFPEIDIFLNTDPLSLLESTGQRGEEERISGNPDRPPKVVKIVEPIIPEEAKQANIKAMILVNFVVLKDGTVKEAYIAEIRKFENNGKDFSIVKDIGFGLLQATIDAAYKWKFRPATENGESVAAYTQEIFSFGF